MRRFSVDASALSLEPRVFDVLLYLLEHRDRVVGRAELMREVWGAIALERSAVSGAIKKLRATLRRCGEPERIQTVRAHGFRFCGPVAESATALRQTPAAREEQAQPRGDWPMIALLAVAASTPRGQELAAVLAHELAVQLDQRGIALQLQGSELRADGESDAPHERGPAFVLRTHVASSDEQVAVSALLIDGISSQVMWSTRVLEAAGEDFPTYRASARIADLLWNALVPGRLRLLGAHGPGDADVAS